MTSKITGFQNRPVQVGTDKSVSRPRDGATSSTGAAAHSHPGSPVRITDQARQLAALEQAVQSTPVVNEARVATIQKAIEEGRYEVVPERIADNLLRMEQELRARD